MELSRDAYGINPDIFLKKGYQIMLPSRLISPFFKVEFSRIAHKFSQLPFKKGGVQIFLRKVSYRYSFKIRNLLCGVFLGVFFVMLLCSSTKAECPPIDKLKKHVVFLEAFKSGDSNNCQKATGVLVSNKGLLLTVYALAKELRLEPSQFYQKNSYEIYVKKKLTDRNDDILKAYIIDYNEQRGLLLLKFDAEKADVMGLIPPKISQTPETPEMKICSVGYASASDAVIKEGKIEGNDVEVLDQCLITTDFDFKLNQRGSPIFDHEGKLIGIASAHTKGDNILKFFVPIEYADVLLSQVLISDLRDQLLEMVDRPREPGTSDDAITIRLQQIDDIIKELRNQIDWTSKVQSSSSCGYYINFKKLVGGPPTIDNATFFIKVTFYDERKAVIGEEDTYISSNPTEMKEGRYGSFCLPELATYIKNWYMSKHRNAKDIKVEITLNDFDVVDESGQVKRKENIVFDFDPIEEPIKKK